MKENVGDMDEPSSLAFDRTLDRRMVVSERIHSDATQEVQILFPGGIPDVDALPAFEQNRQALVGGEEQLALHLRHRSKVHARSTSVPHSMRVK